MSSPHCHLERSRALGFAACHQRDARKSPPLPNSAQKFVSRSLLHLDVGEKFLASILQAGSEDVDHIIDNEEAVVITLAYIYYNRCILLVMTLHIELLLLRELAGVDGGRDVG